MEIKTLKLDVKDCYSIKSIEGNFATIERHMEMKEEFEKYLKRDYRDSLVGITCSTEGKIPVTITRRRYFRIPDGYEVYKYEGRTITFRRIESDEDMVLQFMKTFGKEEKTLDCNQRFTERSYVIARENDVDGFFKRGDIILIDGIIYEYRSKNRKGEIKIKPGIILRRTVKFYNIFNEPVFTQDIEHTYKHVIQCYSIDSEKELSWLLEKGCKIINGKE